MLSANRDTIMSSFPIWIPLISFPSLTAIAGTSKTMLNNNGESEHPCFVPDLRGNAFTFSLLTIMFAVGLSYMVIITFWRVFFFFNHKYVLNFIKSFFCMHWDDHIIFILQFIDVVYSTNWFGDIENSLHPWDKSHLIIAYDPFTVLLNSVC